MLKCVFLSTYPIDRPMHGGQIRSSALKGALDDGFWITKYFCIYDQDGYPNCDLDSWHNPYSQEEIGKLRQSGRRTDVDACDPILENAARLAAIRKLLEEFGPDVFCLEQPWLWPLVKELMKSLKDKVFLVYSSQNNEVLLLEDIVKGLTAADAKRLLDKARYIEDDLLRSCDLLITVSEEDRLSLLARVETKAAHVVIRNGIWPAHFKVPPLKVPATRHYRYVLFVGSAHPPNASGFQAMLSPHLTFLTPDQRVVVVGGVCNLIRNLPMYNDYIGAFHARVMLLGVVAGDDLAALIANADGVLLPITEGGGTNLKTAEALYSRKNIVATAKAFRGYEQFKTFPNVHIEDDPALFKQRLSDVFRSAEAETAIDAQNSSLLAELTWPNTLSSFSQQLRSMVPATIRHGHVGTAFEDILSFGWNEPENGFVWSAEPISALDFKQHPVFERGACISFDAAAFRPPPQGTEIRMYSHSRILMKSRVGDSLTSFAVNVGQQDLYPDGTLELFLRADHIRQPGPGETDPRVLGLRMQNLKVEERTSAVETLSAPSNGLRLSTLVLSKMTRSVRVKSVKLQIDNADGKDVSSQKEIKLSGLEFRSASLRGWVIPVKLQSRFSILEFWLTGRVSIKTVNIRTEERIDVARVYGNPNFRFSGFVFDIPIGTPRGSYALKFIGTTEDGQQIGGKGYTVEIL